MRWVPVCGRVAALIALGVLFGAGCERRLAPPPSVLLVALEGLGPDHMSAYGYGRDTTPNIGGWATGGARFSRAFAHDPDADRSLGALLGIVDPVRPAAVRETHLASLLAKAGYQTFAVAGGDLLVRQPEIGRGFAGVDASFGVSGGGAPGLPACASDPGRRCAHQTTGRALTWLEGLDSSGAGGPFFLFAHYADGVGPQDPPPWFRDRFAPHVPEEVGREDGVIGFVDQEVARLVEGALRVSPELVVIVTSVGRGTASTGLRDRDLRVPLVVWWEGRIAAGDVSDRPVGLADVASTVLELAGVEAPDALAGGGFADVLVGWWASGTARPVLLSQGPAEAPTQGVRTGRWKYLRSPDGRERLIDLTADPAESRDVLPQNPTVASGLAALLPQNQG